MNMTVDETSHEYLDALALRIGRVIVSFTQIEHIVTMTIAAILELNEIQERALVRPMSITNKVSLLRLMTKTWVKHRDRERVKNALHLVEDAADKRNNLAHGFYAHRDGKVAILSFSGSAKLAGDPVAWTPDHLRRICERARAASGRT